MGTENISYKPLYLQVKDILLKKIKGKKYKPGAPIPTEAELSKELGTSISTIRQALSILVSEGYIVRKQGKGTFVSDE